MQANKKNCFKLSTTNFCQSWKFLLYISPNLIDIGGNLIRLTIFYAWVISLPSAAPVTRGDLVVFVGEMLYFYYNTQLFSGFVLKVKNPTKDVLRFVHKDANKDIAVLEDGLDVGLRDANAVDEN